MKELSIHIRVTPLQHLHSKTYNFVSDAFDFNPVPEDSNAGRVFNCDKDIVIDNPEHDVLIDFKTPQPSIVEISDTRGKQYRIGDYQIPALVSIIPHFNNATLQMRCKMIFSPLI